MTNGQIDCRQIDAYKALPRQPGAAKRIRTPWPTLEIISTVDLSWALHVVSDSFMDLFENFGTATATVMMLHIKRNLGTAQAAEAKKGKV